MQLALMKPNVSDIKIHVDAGGYAQRGHRIHVPLYTNEGVLFNQCPIKVGADGKKVQVRHRVTGRECVCEEGEGGGAAGRRGRGKL
jgi:hypothetical protein